MNSKGFKNFTNMAGKSGFGGNLGGNPIKNIIAALLIGGVVALASSSVYYGNIFLI